VYTVNAIGTKLYWRDSLCLVAAWLWASQNEICPIKIISCFLISSTQRFLCCSCKMQAHAHLTSVQFTAALLLSHARSLHIHGYPSQPLHVLRRFTAELLSAVLLTRDFVIPSSVRILTSVEA